MNAFFIIPTNWKSQIGELFMDHPPLEKRLAALARDRPRDGQPVDTAVRPSTIGRVEEARATC